MADLNVNSIGDASGGATTSINGFTPSVSNMAGRNRIINGDMRIDQRNAGASYTQVNGAYSLDRWAGNSYDGGAATNKFSVQQSTTAPAGFSNSLLVTSLAATADSGNDIYNIEQKIEGFNSADFAFGTASAKTITLSFWVRSSLTGTFGGAIKNSARDRAYPFAYTISSANTFEYKTITIAGDTSGTWVGATNGTGLWLSFGLGVSSNRSNTAGAWAGGDLFSSTGATRVIGTSGATWQVTGVQLEEGSVATPFEHRQYGQELALCQRYYNKFSLVTYQRLGIGYADLNSRVQMNTFLPVMLRTTPTATFSSVTVEGTNITSIGSIQGDKNLSYVLNHGSSYASGETWQVYSGSANGYIDFSAEL